MSGGADPLEGVGATSLLTAASRALETEKANGLVSDPLARPLAGSRGFELFARAPGPQASNGTPLYVIRHRFLDDLLTGITATSPVRQIVLLAAGLDARAFRLDWPPGTRLFEVDQPQVFAHKEAVLEAEEAAARCERIVVPADLREDWPRDLLARGFDPDQATVWVAEGLLFYLPEAAVRRLLDETRRLSAPGSYFAGDVMSVTPGPPQEVKDAFVGLGAPFVFATDDPIGLFAEHGWQAEPIPMDEVGRRLGVELPVGGRIVVARR